MSVISDVKQKADITSVIGQYIKLTKAGRNLRGLCPFHGEKNPSFFIYPEQQSWHCFGCNSGGDVFSFIMKKENVDFGEALRLLAEKNGVVIPSKFEREDRKEEDKLYQVNEAAAQYFHNLLLNSPAAEKARGHIASRGLLPKTISDFKLGYSLDSWDSLKQYMLEKGYSQDELLGAGLIVEAENKRTYDRFRGRLIFPIRDERGRTIGFGGRALDDSQPKYLNSSQTAVFDKSSTLYGLDFAAKAIRQRDMAIIVEGYMDAITAHQYDITNVVASMGTAITERHASKLKKLTRNVVLALDSDAAGEEAMLRAVSYENVIDGEIKVVILPEGKDPDEVIKEDIKGWQKLVDEAVPIVDYTFKAVASKLDLTTARDKASAAEMLLPTVAAIGNPVRQAHYMQQLARLVKTSERTIELALSRLTSGKPKTRERHETTTSALRPTISDPLEENCLALLMQHPELKSSAKDLLPEYFEHSENCEIFKAWCQNDDLSLLREKLDSALHEHLDLLANKQLPATNLEQRYASFALRLRERFLKNVEAKRAEIFALEAETGGTGADLAKLEMEGIEPSAQLREVFTQKRQRRTETRR